MPTLAPGQALELPGGLVLGDGRRLGDAELRPITGREEDWLAVHGSAPSAAVVTSLLNSCLVRLGDREPTLDLVRGLLAGDRDYLMLQLRRATLGDEFQAVYRCPACGARMDVTFTAGDVPVDVRPQDAESYAVVVGGRAVSFRLPCGGDQEAVLALEESRRGYELLRRCILQDGAEELMEDELAAIAAEMERRAPKVELELDLACPECAHQFVTAFDTTAFFIAEMRTNRRQLLLEVHSLAFYYHWSEAEILGLRRGRRREYLGLLADALRGD